MKRLLFLLLLILTLLSGCGMATKVVQEKIVKAWGTAPYDLVALKEIPMLQGSAGGNFLGWGGSVHGGMGIMFAIKVNDGSIRMLQVPIERVVIIYADELAQLIEITSKLPDYKENICMAEFLVKHGTSFVIRLPKGSSCDFLRTISN